MALVGGELETLVSEPDALTTRPFPCENFQLISSLYLRHRRDECFKTFSVTRCTFLQA